MSENIELKYDIYQPFGPSILKTTLPRGFVNFVSVVDKGFSIFENILFYILNMIFELLQHKTCRIVVESSQLITLEPKSPHFSKIVAIWARAPP